MNNETIIIIVIIIILVAIGLIIYVNSLSTTKCSPITDCSLFASKSAAIGTENGPKCLPGTEEFEEICYKDVWTAEGGEKVAVCTVNWGQFGGTVTNCDIGIQKLSIGAPCPMVGEGYHKTEVCTCQLRGEVTAELYCQDEGVPNICKKDWDFFGEKCYFHSCPDNWKRTEICTCTPN